MSTVRPEWFTLREDHPSPWATVRVPEEHVEAFLLEVADAWTHPESRHHMAALFRPYVALLPRLARSAGEHRWDQASGWELVHTLESAVAVERAHATFLPAPFDTLDADTRRALYAHVLIAAGVTAVAENTTATLLPVGEEAELPAAVHDLPPDQRALLPAARAEFARLAGPYVEAELCRRARERRGHLGLNVSFLLLSAAALRQLGVSAALVDTRDGALDRLVNAALARGAGGRAQRLDRGASRDDVRGDLGAFLWESLPQAWRDLDAFEAMARGAEGQFNEVAQRHDHRIIDALRREKVRERFTIDLAGPRTDDEDEATDPIETLRDETAPRKAATRELIATLRGSPDGTRVLEAIPYVTTITELAEWLGLSRRELGRLIRPTRPVTVGIAPRSASERPAE